MAKADLTLTPKRRWTAAERERRKALKEKREAEKHAAQVAERKAERHEVAVERIREAADMRVRGGSWEEIADKYGYKDGHVACVVLTQKHKADWTREFTEAYLARGDVAACKAMTKMEKLLECGDHRVEQSAAHSLLNNYRQIRTKMQLELSGSVNMGDKPAADMTLDELTEWALRNNTASGT